MTLFETVLSMKRFDEVRITAESGEVYDMRVEEAEHDPADAPYWIEEHSRYGYPKEAYEIGGGEVDGISLSAQNQRGSKSVSATLDVWRADEDDYEGVMVEVRDLEITFTRISE